MSRLRKLPFVICAVLALSVNLPPASAAPSGTVRSFAEDAQRLLRLLDGTLVGDGAPLKTKRAQSKGTLPVKRSCGIDPNGQPFCTP